MPLLGLGTWRSPPGEVTRAVQHALTSGYRHLDCASAYGNEKVETELRTSTLGIINIYSQEVAAGIKASGVSREEIFITSKLWNNKHHPDDVEAACKKTLSDLGLAYLDLYLIHWPHAFKRGEETFPKKENGDVIYDETIHPTDTWFAMEKLVEKGLVKSIGTFSALKLT